MSNLTAEQEDALRKSLGDVVQTVALRTGTDITALRAFLIKANELAKNAAAQVNAPYSVQFSSGGTGKDALTLPRLAAALNKGVNYFTTDADLRIVSDGQAPLDLVNAQKRTESSNSVELLARGLTTYLVCSGMLLEESRADGSPFVVPMDFSWRRTIGELKSILAEHYEHVLKNEKQLQYWHDRKSRILLCSPTKTEELFHHNLHWWLDHFVADKIQVVSDPSGAGQDKTDVRVITHEGTTVIEIKWLGRNANNTEYKEKRIEEGLEQVKIYLNNNPTWMRGHLVVYDGRPRNEHETSSSFSPDALHTQCHPPHLIFLESESPSEAAPRIVKERAKAKRTQRPVKTPARAVKASTALSRSARSKQRSPPKKKTRS